MNNQNVSDISSSVAKYNNINITNADLKGNNEHFKTHRIILYGICAISLLCSLVSLCRTFPCSANFDYMGVIVSIFSGLITFLVGWQIFDLIKIEHIKSDIKNKQNEINFDIEQNKVEIHSSLCTMYRSGLERRYSDINAFRYTLNHLYLIIALHHTGEQERCDISADALIVTLSKFGKIHLTRQYYDTLIPLIREAIKCTSQKSSLLLNIMGYIAISDDMTI